MKRLTRVVLVVALAIGLLWVMWQAVDRTAWEDSTLWNVTTGRVRPDPN